MQIGVLRPAFQRWKTNVLNCAQLPLEYAALCLKCDRMISDKRVVRNWMPHCILERLWIFRKMFVQLYGSLVCVSLLHEAGFWDGAVTGGLGLAHYSIGLAHQHLSFNKQNNLWRKVFAYLENKRSMHLKSPGTLWRSWSCSLWRSSFCWNGNSNWIKTHHREFIPTVLSPCFSDVLISDFFQRNCSSTKEENCCNQAFIVFGNTGLIWHKP